MKLYLAGPMAGYPEHNFPEFRQGRAVLESVGYEILSPLDNGCLPTDDTSKHMRADILMICRAEGVAVLPGGEFSRGVRTEICVAEAVKIPVMPVWAWVNKAMGEMKQL